MSKWAYDFTNEELMEALWKAIVQAGVSGSGLVIDCAAGFHRIEAYYLYGVALSRLEGKKPPFTRGDKVRVSPRATYLCQSVNVVGEHHSHGQAGLKKTHEVGRIFYEKNGKWTLSFKGDQEEYRFPADRFEKVEQKKSAA